MPNPFCHVEISTADLKKAGEFYSQLFEWKINPWGESQNYSMIDTGKEPGGGLMKVDRVTPGEGVIVHVQVEDVAKMLLKVQELGGKIIKEKTEIPDIGWFGLFTDLDGNIIGLFQGK